MKAEHIPARTLLLSGRADAWHHLSPGARASRILDGLESAEVPVVPLGSSDIGASVWAPARFKRIYATAAEEKLPYLRPYDVFDYLPVAADHLSRDRSLNREALVIDPGTILQTCSGRNLGPAVMADRYLSRFALSHDIIRMEIPDEELRFYILAFIWTPTGQALLRRDKSGSVIDHITVGHVTNLRVPLLPDEVRRAASDLARRAFELRARARQRLSDAVDQYGEAHPFTRSQPLRAGWTIAASALAGRIDAARYDPNLAPHLAELRSAGAVPLGDVADVRRPPGRYKTYYVPPPHGTPLLSGRQLLQDAPVGLKRISPRSFSDASQYTLESGWLAMPIDGRAGERLGSPVVVTPERAGWMASGHVGRVVPRDPRDAGWLWACMSSPLVQAQLSALACGSVVDALYEEDIRGVLLPPPPEAVDGDELVQAWSSFGDAHLAQQEAVTLLEDALSAADAARRIA